MATDIARIFDPSRHEYAVKAVVYGNRLSKTKHETDKQFVKRIVRAYLRALSDE